MEILEYGSKDKEKIILIHGFESPYQIWDKYIDYFKKDYCVIVPILPGHNPNKEEQFISFDSCAKELEDFYINKYGDKVYAIYGMSMGGVLASHIWKNKRLAINKLILESSSLLPYGKKITNLLTKQYLSITHKAQKREQKTVKKAINTMVREEQLPIFLNLLDHISDATIINYIQEIAKFILPTDIHTPNTDIYYFYGGKINELFFKRAAKFLKKHYSNAKTICLKRKGHCEDALLNPEARIEELNEILYEGM